MESSMSHKVCRLAIMALTLAVTVISPAVAGDVKTACPEKKPGKPNILYRYGEIWPEGYRSQFESDAIVRNGELVHVYYDLSDFNSDHAVLMCEFKDRTRIEYPIPGLLLRCGMTIRNYDSKTKPIEWLDVWCISDDERKALPRAKK